MQGSSDLTSLTANSCYFRSSKTISTSFFSLAFISSGPREAEEHACNTIAQRGKKGLQRIKKYGDLDPRGEEEEDRGRPWKQSQKLQNLFLGLSIHQTERRWFLALFWWTFSSSTLFLSFFLFSERVLNVKGLDLQDSDQKDFFVQVFGGIKCSSQLNIWDCKKQNFWRWVSYDQSCFITSASKSNRI